MPYLPNVTLAAPEIETLPGVLRRLKDGVDEYAPAAANAGKHSRELEDEVVGLTGTVNGVNEVIAATPGHLADVNASFAVTSGERLPEVIGQMGTLEDQTLATVDALGRLAATPRTPTRSGGASGGGGSASSHQTHEDDFLSTPAPPNVEELFQQQKKDHDISGFRDAHHWWREHLKHVARLRAEGHAFAQGTAFAPGGMALVGEMGPELVNLPRGSQVIPNPRLGSEVTVNVTVEGSVVAERDLAQRIRQELIRTSRRTVDLGFN